MLDKELCGPFIPCKDEMFCDSEHKKSTLKGLSAVKEDLLVSTDDQAYTIVNDLEETSRKYVYVRKDGDCLYAAVLSSINVPHGFNISIFWRQIVAYALQNVDFFRKRLSYKKESFESFLHNLSGGFCMGIGTAYT